MRGMRFWCWGRPRANGILNKPIRLQRRCRSLAGHSRCTQLLPRLLSNALRAYLGEAAILFNLTRMPRREFPSRQGGSIPNFVPDFPIRRNLAWDLILFVTSLRALVMAKEPVSDFL